MDKAKEVVNKSKFIKDAPITFSFLEKKFQLLLVKIRVKLKNLCKISSYN